MKRSLLLATTILFGIAGIQSTDAQGRRRNERVIISMQVDSWGPKSGPAGTVVTLNGRGFTRKIQILVGGRLVRPTTMGSSAISFRIPASVGNGQIVLRKPGSTDDYLVGNFQAAVSPQVLSFAPNSGTPGTLVQLRGRDLNGVRRITLGTTPIKINRVDPRGSSLVVTIPPGATSGFFMLYDERNIPFKSRNAFTIVAPAPYVSDFTPRHGPPSSTVRLSGGNYGTDVQAFYGRSPMKILRRGVGWLDIEIPARAKRDQAIHIRSPRGGQRSKILFVLEYPAFVSAYSPSWGAVGTRIQLRGKNFMAGDRVTIGGQSCKILQLQENQITIVVPRNAHTGAISVARGAQILTTSGTFEVVYPPRIADLSPYEGAPGTRVVVRGEGFQNSLFFLGETPIRANWIKGNQMQFTIPPKSQSGLFRVVSRGGESSSVRPFRVWNFPRISRISPARGGYNKQIILTGKALANAETVLLAGQAMPVVSRSRARIIVRVPRGAQSGRISWVAFGQTRPTRWNFSVIAPPLLNSFSPQEGGPNTLVTVLGQGFDARSQVFYGSQAVRAQRRTPTSLQFRVPSNVTKSQYITIDSEGGRAQSPTLFGYVAIPTIRRFWPSRSKPGAELNILGQSLTMNTVVKIGQVTTRNLGLNPDGSLRVAIPNTLPASRYTISVQSRGLRATARRTLQIDSWGQVYDIRPRVARTGQTIMLNGSTLFDVRVFFGQIEMPVIKRDRPGRRIWVQVPTNCTGRSVLTIDDNGHQANTTVALEIAAPRRPIDIRDHRRGKRPLPRRPRRR